MFGESRGNANRDDAAHGLGDHQVAGCGERGRGKRYEIVKATNRAVVRLVAKPWPGERDLLPGCGKPLGDWRPELTVAAGARQQQDTAGSLHRDNSPASSVPVALPLRARRLFGRPG